MNEKKMSARELQIAPECPYSRQDLAAAKEAYRSTPEWQSYESHCRTTAPVSESMAKDGCWS